MQRKDECQSGEGRVLTMSPSKEVKEKREGYFISLSEVCNVVN